MSFEVQVEIPTWVVSRVDKDREYRDLEFRGDGTYLVVAIGNDQSAMARRITPTPCFFAFPHLFLTFNHIIGITDILWAIG